MDKYCSKKCGHKLMERLENTGTYKRSTIMPDSLVPIYRIIEYCPVPNFLKAGHDEIYTDRFWSPGDGMEG